MATNRELQGFREWLRKKGVSGLPDSEVDRVIRSTRKQMYFWGVVIFLLLLGGGAVLWRALQ